MKYDKFRLQECIWQNPTAVIPLNWQQRGREWRANQYPDGSEGGKRADRTTLKLSSDGLQIFAHCNGTFGSFQGGDIWQFIQWRHNTNDFNEALEIVADAYGIQPDYSGYSADQIKEAKDRRQERDLLKIAAKYITAAINTPAGKPARNYATRRGLQISDRIGAYSSEIRAGLKTHLQQHGATPERAEQLLRRWFTTYIPEAHKDFTDDYCLALPFTNGKNNVIGFVLRLTADDIYYNDAADGTRKEKSKYRYSAGMARGCGYCEQLQGGDAENVYIVEGILDAEAMKQNGFHNVIALGGMTPAYNENEPQKSAIKTLIRYSAKKLYYIADCEYYDAEDEAKGRGAAGQRKEGATHATIKALLPYIQGGTFIALRIVDIQTADGLQKHEKEDADSILHKDYGAAILRDCIDKAKQWYEYELKTIVKDHSGDVDLIQAKAVEVYRQISNYGQRELLKDDITTANDDGYLQQIRAAGLNAAALSLIDRDGVGALYQQQMKEIVDALKDAKTPETIGYLLNKAQRVQNINTFNDFATQIGATKEDLHRRVAKKPDYLETTWKLWKENDAGRCYPNRNIGFAPAAVSIAAAPTNHGKTLFLLQTALNAAKTKQQRIIYASLENDAEQLYIRALAAYMGNAWKPDEKNPRGKIRDYIKTEDMPETLYKADGGLLDIGAYINDYWRTIARNLKLLRCSADIDAVVSNMTQQIELWRNAGIETAAIFVDYLQLLHAPNIRAHSRTDEVKYICDRLNDMAKQTKLPVILAAQLNRDATRNNGDLLDGVELANIGESAGIENIAEDVYLIWNTNKIKTDNFTTNKDGELNLSTRTRRCFKNCTDKNSICRNYLYIENLKARDYATGGYCLLPFNGAAGAITADTSSNIETTKKQ